MANIRAHILIKGMHCAGCSVTIENKLKNNVGIKDTPATDLSCMSLYTFINRTTAPPAIKAVFMISGSMQRS